MSVYPTNFRGQLLDSLPMPTEIHAIPPKTKVLGAYATPDLAGLMLLFN